MRLLPGQINHHELNAAKLVIVLIILASAASFFVHLSYPQWAVAAALNALLFVYFAPSLIAIWCNRPSVITIVGVNTLLGVTGAGWVAALAWSLYDPHKSQTQPGSYELQVQLRHLNAEIDSCRKQIDELRQHIILINDHQSYANKMIESLTKPRRRYPDN